MGYAPIEYGTDDYMDIPLMSNPGWLSVLLSEFDKPYMKKLYEKLTANRESISYPSLLFQDYNGVDYDDVEIVIIHKHSALTIDNDLVNGIIKYPFNTEPFTKLNQLVLDYQNNPTETTLLKHNTMILNMSLTPNLPETEKEWLKFSHKVINVLSNKLNPPMFVYVENKKLIYKNYVVPLTLQFL